MRNTPLLFNGGKNFHIMKQKPVIIGIGEILWDLLPTGKKAGGAPVNFAFHAAASGVESYAISAIGSDPEGDEMMRELNKHNIRYLIEKVDHPTGTVRVELKSGIPTYTITEEVAWDYIPLTEEMKHLAARCDAICFGTLAQRSEVSRNTIRTLLSLTPPDSYRILDINIRQQYYNKETILTSLQLCNICKMNDEEVQLIKSLFNKEGEDNERVCKWLMENFSLQMMILTAGDRESTIYTSSEVSRIGTPRVTVADTVGAGDAFTGTLIASLLEGKTVAEAHSDAVQRAAFVCTREGAWVSELSPVSISLHR